MTSDPEFPAGVTSADTLEVTEFPLAMASLMKFSIGGKVYESIEGDLLDLPDKERLQISSFSVSFVRSPGGTMARSSRFPERNEFAQMCKANRNRVRRSLQRLHERGYIKIRNLDQRGRRSERLAVIVYSITTQFFLGVRNLKKADELMQAPPTDLGKCPIISLM